jgi:hypothetical protein
VPRQAVPLGEQRLEQLLPGAAVQVCGVADQAAAIGQHGLEPLQGTQRVAIGCHDAPGWSYVSAVICSARISR